MNGLIDNIGRAFAAVFGFVVCNTVKECFCNYRALRFINLIKKRMKFFRHLRAGLIQLSGNEIIRGGRIKQALFITRRTLEFAGKVVNLEIFAVVRIGAVISLILVGSRHE